MNLSRSDIDRLIGTAVEAGERIMEIYAEPIEVSKKEDLSPLTAADMASHNIILEALHTHFPDIPVISEEHKNLDYSIRKDWKKVWLVDPLDGTKEFIKKNGEFTVNIALVQDGRPLFGIVYLPAKEWLYYGIAGKGAFRIREKKEEPINVRMPEKGGVLKLAGSRSHPSPDMAAFVEKQKARYREVELIAAGSSLKFCLLAEGTVHAYPRLGPTMEWDTAAGHALLRAAGGEVLNFESGTELLYNKENLLNPSFLALAGRGILEGID